MYCIVLYCIVLYCTLCYIQVKVTQRPKVAVLSTGNEVVNPGEQLRPGQIYDSNRTSLLAAVREHGMVAVDLGVAKDE